MNSLRSPAFYAFGAGLAALLLFSNFGRGSTTSAPRQPAGSIRPVIVELFTSEGCSSCPPADALLKELSEQHPLAGVQVVALEEHVDYWNNLGWADPFSSNQFSERQGDYAQVFGRDGVYTPQMIVDGQTEFVGSRSHSAREAIQRAANLPKLEVALRFSENSAASKAVLEVEAQNPSGIQLHDALELWVAVTEKGLQSDVKAGENSGEILKHAAIVRSLARFDTLRDAAGYQNQVEVTLDPKWKKENVTIVAFLAEKGTHKIVGGASAPLNSSAMAQ